MKTLPTIIILSVFTFINIIKLRAQCECSDSMERAEIKLIYFYYRDAVNNARSNGYQCGGDTNYIDKGDGKHPVGNCADWAQVTWGALRVHQWHCWKVVKYRARKKFTITSMHHFVYVESCSGVGYYLDPWKTGSPDIWAKDAFPVQGGFWGGWVIKALVVHHVGDPPSDPGNDP